jgi:lipopolysaccharide heptosyltransferase III
VPPRPPADPPRVAGAAETPSTAVPRRGGEHANEYVVLHPSPLYRYKAWTVDGWRALTRHLIERGFDVRLTGGSAEAERALLRAIVEGLPAEQRDHVADLAGALPFAALTPLIEGARLFVGPDTSVTHLAAATGTPTVALFGPSHPVAWGPWPAHHAATGASPWVLRAPLQQQGNVWLIQGEAPCVPCRGEGCDKHPGSRSLCLDEMSPERVIGLVEQALARPRFSAGGAGPTGT